MQINLDHEENSSTSRESNIYYMRDFIISIKRFCSDNSITSNGKFVIQISFFHSVLFEIFGRFAHALHE